VRIRRSALEDFIAVGESRGLADVATAEDSEIQGPEAGSTTGLSAEGRERLAAAPAESSAALTGQR